MRVDFPTRIFPMQLGRQETCGSSHILNVDSLEVVSYLFVPTSPMSGLQGVLFPLCKIGVVL